VDKYIEWFAVRDENQGAADWEGLESVQLKTERYGLEGVDTDNGPY